ncbi:MAG TPA: lysoplasmalogenase [Pyrinomonadaceae bacterium]|jgi:uncharacterized membrane protein YhhN|nr:lysoplasmalogenase [Pyrinomonadaceae bacterium]
MLIIALILTAFISAALEIRAEYKGPAIRVYLLKPLTLVCIILITLQNKHESSFFYQSMIVAGLSCSLIGDIFLMLPSDRFRQGLVSFLFGHLCYIAAFATGAASPSALASLIPLVLYGGVMMRVLLPHLENLKLPVLVYMLVIMLMGWQALVRYLSAGSASSLLALAGALLFIASDSLLALNRFKAPFKSAQLLILTTYFIAQTFIALSV